MSKPVGVAPLRLLREWAELFRDRSGPAYRALAGIYGPDHSLLREKAGFVLRVIAAFGRTFDPEAKVFLVRSAGRINLIGMHVDHRGGAVNTITIRETWFVCQPRDDDVLDCVCLKSSIFGRQDFSIRRELGTEAISDWDRWTQALAEKRAAEGTAGNWIDYVKSAALYLQHVRSAREPSAPPLRGMNVMIGGTIPMSAGLSSSSSIVVGAAEAMIHRNGLDVSGAEFVDLCGQAEWYVGTRGGAGDHAAIRFGRQGHVAHLGSHPLTVEVEPFPTDLRVVLCNSLIEAKKSESARDEFNNRIASYEFGLMLLRKAFPQRAPAMEQLRDVNPQTLGVSEAEIYRMLLQLPQRLPREKVLKALSGQADRVEHIFGSHARPKNGYPIRKICAFGIAECLRSQRAAEALKRGDIEAFGEIVNVSHNGDRVTRIAGTGERVPMDKSLTDGWLRKRIADLESDDPMRVERSRLWRMPGGYDTSLPEIDTIVDACLSTPGVVAARLVGAGLGGAVHAVVRREHVRDVMKNVARHYYEPHNLEPAAEVYSSMGGSGVFSV